MKKSRTLFADTDDGRLFVRAEAVMTPLVALVDGVRLVSFGREKSTYIEVDEAIAWCRKESAFHSKEKYEKMIEIMEKAKSQQAKANQQP